MSEIIHVKRDGRIIQLPNLSSIKAGEHYRISTLTLKGPWRTAAADAKPANKPGAWHVRPTSATSRSNGYGGK